MPLIRSERLEATVLLSFSRPPVNAFNLPLVEEFSSALQDLAADPPAGGVVLSGDGGVFSAGVDLKEVPRYNDEEGARVIALVNRALRALYSLPTATVAAVDGHAIGGAFVMMLACDTRIASDRPAKLALTQVTTSIVYPAGPLEILRAEMKPGLRRQMMLSGEPIEPALARDRGIADELHAPEDLIERALEVGASARGRAVVCRREGAAAARDARAPERGHRRPGRGRRLTEPGAGKSAVAQRITGGEENSEPRRPLAGLAAPASGGSPREPSIVPSTP